MKSQKKTTKTSASLRVARRERRRERSREEIIAAAREVMLREGIGATTLDAIAQQVGLTKAALYYYFPSKDALFFEIVYDIFQREAQALNDGATRAKNGREALRAIVGETVKAFAPQMDDFRIAFLHPQVSNQGSVKIGGEQLARLRPLNDLSYKGAVEKLRGRGRAGVEPRLMVFLANVAALGILTMKGLVETFGDPLLYSDDQLVDALARIFEVAAEP